MSVATCKHCGETIMTPAMETYYIHTRTGMAQCGIRYATPVNPTADESAWTEFDLQEFWEGLNGIEPIGAMSEPIVNVTDEPLTSAILSEGCIHDWANKAGTEYRSNPVAVCIKCGEEL
jgi:hypothetical protein